MINVKLVKYGLRTLIGVYNLFLSTTGCIPEAMHKRLVEFYDDIEYFHDNTTDVKKRELVMKHMKYEIAVLSAYSNVRYLDPKFNNEIIYVKTISKLEKMEKEN